MKTLNFVSRPHFSMVSPFPKVQMSHIPQCILDCFPNPLRRPFFEGAKCPSRGTWSDFGSFSVFPRSRNDAKIDPILVRRLKKPWRGARSETTCFSQNHSNPCAVGTSWLLKGHFFDGDWLIFCFCCVSLCSVLYNIFIILLLIYLSKNIVKHPAVDPFVF